MTTPLDLEAIEETYPVGCHACGDTVQTCDGFYYDHGACDASGKPVPEGVERRPPDHVDDLIAEVRRLREEQQGLHEDVVYVGASCDRELTIDGVALRAARFSPTRHDVERLTRERDEAIALERERCAALVREIPACQPGAKATAARRWLDDRVAACVRAIVVDDETATCARASVRDAMERAKAAEANAARVSEAYALDIAGLRETLRRADDLRVMWRERVADVASERDALRAELDATRAALRANLRCDECDDLATRCHADTARFGCEAHGVGEGWSDTTHAAVVREALR
jgi:hypothetical protein